MNQAEVEQISRDAAAVFTGLRVGKVFPLGRGAIAIDFFPHSGEYLYVNCDTRVRSCYLITRRLKDLERTATHASPFVIQMRKVLSGREVKSIEASNDADKVIVVESNSIEGRFYKLVIQLGGRRPNILILDETGTIVDALYDTSPNDQTASKVYLPPPRKDPDEPVRETGEGSLSEVLDLAERVTAIKADIERLASAARRRLNADITKRRRLIDNLENDLARQGSADQWKRYGDLILANMANLRRVGDALIVTDHFDPEQGEIAIPVNKDISPAEAAESFFRRYTKARNGAAEISKRLQTVRAEIEKLQVRSTEIEAAILRDDTAFLSGSLPVKRPAELQDKRQKKTPDFKGVRRFVSSDGFEILVGKKAKDNDHLTFRIAKSLDLWLHTADYPGSHVVVRNAGRNEVPTRTLTEAAQLAAFYSHAREQPKAAVRYTQRKFVNKPKRAAPGLVSLASFKTILVEPKIAVEARISD